MLDNPWIAYLSLTFTFISLVLSVIVGLAFLRWVFNVSYNLNVRSRIKPRFGPFASIFWFLIPIANLFLPYLVLSNLQKVVSKQQDSHKRELNRIYGWGFLFHFLTTIGSRIDLTSGSLGTLVTVLLFESFALFFLGLMFINVSRFIRGVTDDFTILFQPEEKPNFRTGPESTFNEEEPEYNII